MPIDFDNLFGIHEQALKLRARRTEVLASNLANADTPGYKARDIDFQSMLQDYQSGGAGSGMKATQPGHIRQGTAASPDLLYRTPMQPSVDGNTVDSQTEKSKFMENSLRYQASLSFVEGRLKALMSAIRCE